MEKQLSQLSNKYQHNDVALRLFDTISKEIAIYKQYSDYYGYEFFILQK